MTYTYNPELLPDNHKDRMRMELGDTAVDGKEESCALSDEEYNAIIDYYTLKCKRGFSFAKLKCLEAICFKMFYETDTKIGQLSYRLSERAELWSKMYEVQRSSLGVPIANHASLGVGRSDAGHYFYGDVLGNIRAANSSGKRF